jgi:glycosyltransferase involved in cell wall biosynthesis
MINNPKIFIIVPAYNEEEKIAEVLSNLTNNYENIVVIDDASQDKTTDIIKKFPVTLLEHKINRGQGAALETGNQYAFDNGADIIVHFDADGQFLVNEIEDLIKPIIHEGYDIVLGSRFLEKKSKMPWFKKHVIHFIARIINRIFFGIKMTDPQSGFRAMSVDAARKIEIEQDEMAHCSEILHKAFKYKLKIKEIPMTVIYHRFGNNFSGGLKILKDLIFKKIVK